MGMAAFALLPVVVLRAQSAQDAAKTHGTSDPDDDTGLTGAIEVARRTRDETKLESLKTQIEQRISEHPSDPVMSYQLARVHGYLIDVYEARKDKKLAGETVDRAIEAVQHSLQLNDNSADAHSLLADLYGRKISLSNPMFAGPKFGPKIEQENKRALELDDKNPRVWASLGRQYLMKPKMFGGDIPKAIESFQKSLALDTQQDETYVWLAKAYQKHGQKAEAREAAQHALQLNPQSKFASSTLGSIR